MYSKENLKKRLLIASTCAFVDQCRLQLLESFPCTWRPFLPSLLRIIALKYLSDSSTLLHYISSRKHNYYLAMKAYATVEFVTRGRTRTIQFSDFIGCSRHWVELAASEGPDDHFTWVLSLFSIENYLTTRNSVH